MLCRHLTVDTVNYDLIHFTFGQIDFFRSSYDAQVDFLKNVTYAINVLIPVFIAFNIKHRACTYSKYPIIRNFVAQIWLHLVDGVC